MSERERVNEGRERERERVGEKDNEGRESMIESGRATMKEHQ